MKKYLRARQSLFIALGVIVLLTLWLVSGRLGRDTSAEQSAENAEVRDTLISVRTRTFEAREISREIVISGRTEPARAVTLRAEIDGRIISLGAERGARVEQGDVIARIDLRDLRARLRQAQATVTQRKLEFQAAEKLLQQNLQSEVNLARARANLEAARAVVERIKIDIANTTLRAPFKGVLDKRPVEVGTYVSAGDQVGRVIEQHPILVTGNVTQEDVHRLVLGDRGIARLVTGQVAEGVVRFIASEADEATRTFRVELEIPNPDSAFVSGITSEIRIPVRMLKAYHLSPALLSLNSDDQLGVKSVNADGLVEFHGAEIVRATADGLWVSGLPPALHIITVGQGFVQAGDSVRAVQEDEIDGPASEDQDR